jgi:hypothetical protein
VVAKGRELAARRLVDLPGTRFSCSSGFASGQDDPLWTPWLRRWSRGLAAD